ncbi:MAG: 6-carboxytetrahydropterin synthase [Coxiellaceae bacterium]|nr:6-carboxytetrahydropterin synthase [Coxiellaceae bacterium]
MSAGNNTLTYSTVELYREDMKFSAAHFTIFNAEERERLHGHNYQVHTYIKAAMDDSGITYDYSITRKQVLALCRSLNEYMLLPAQSPYLQISEEGEYYAVQFQQDKMLFLKKECILLPIKNTTSECLAQWFVDQITENKDDLAAKRIVKVKVSVSTTRGQCSIAKWKAPPP